MTYLRTAQKSCFLDHFYAYYLSNRMVTVCFLTSDVGDLLPAIDEHCRVHELISGIPYYKADRKFLSIGNRCRADNHGVAPPDSKPVPCRSVVPCGQYGFGGDTHDPYWEAKFPISAGSHASTPDILAETGLPWAS